MVYLCNNILKRNEKIEEFYKTPKAPSRLTNTEIKDYLACYGEINDNSDFDFKIPLPIMSPINKPKRGLEFRSYNTGSIEFFGPAIYKKVDSPEQYVRDGKAHFSGRKIDIDTYFNKVLYQAWKRKIIRLDRNDRTIFLNDLFSLRLTRAFKRDSVQNRNFKRKMDKLFKLQKESMNSDIIVGVI